MRGALFPWDAGAGVAHSRLRRTASTAEEIAVRAFFCRVGERKLLERLTVLTDSFRCLLVSACCGVGVSRTCPCLGSTKQKTQLQSTSKHLYVQVHTALPGHFYACVETPEADVI